MYKSLPLVSFPVFPFINMHNWETASYILFSAKTQIYKQNKYTYTQSGGKKSLFQFCLTYRTPFSPIYLEEMKNYWSLSVSRTVSQVIMQVHKPIVSSLSLASLAFWGKTIDSDRPHFLWVYWRDNLLWMLGEHSKSL